MAPTILILLISALLITLLIESVIVLPLFHKHCNSFSKLVINFILINAITNLTLNTLIVIGIASANWLELIIPLIEAALFSYTGIKRSRKAIILICYIANFFSWAIGLPLIDILFAGNLGFLIPVF